MRMFWRWSQRAAPAAGRKVQELRLDPRPRIIGLARKSWLAALNCLSGRDAQHSLRGYVSKNETLLYQMSVHFKR